MKAPNNQAPIFNLTEFPPSRWELNVLILIYGESLIL